MIHSKEGSSIINSSSFRVVVFLFFTIIAGNKTTAMITIGLSRSDSLLVVIISTSPVVHTPEREREVSCCTFPWTVVNHRALIFMFYALDDRERLKNHKTLTSPQSRRQRARVRAKKKSSKDDWESEERLGARSQMDYFMSSFLKESEKVGEEWQNWQQFKGCRGTSGR